MCPALIRSSEVWCLKCGDATHHFWINNEYHFANILIAFSIIEHFLRQGPHKPDCVDSSFLVYLTTCMSPILNKWLHGLMNAQSKYSVK